jgi:hypothetical protein
VTHCDIQAVDFVVVEVVRKLYCVLSVFLLSIEGILSALDPWFSFVASNGSDNSHRVQWKDRAPPALPIQPLARCIHSCCRFRVSVLGGHMGSWELTH